MTITVEGIALIADSVSGRLQQPITLMGIGIGTPTDTTLGDEIPGTRHGVTKYSVDNIAYYKGHWDIDDEFAADITEMALFNKDNVMVAVASFDPISKTLYDPLQVTWRFLF